MLCWLDAPHWGSHGNHHRHCDNRHNNNSNINRNTKTKSTSNTNNGIDNDRHSNSNNKSNRSNNNVMARRRRTVSKCACVREMLSRAPWTSRFMGPSNYLQLNPKPSHFRNSPSPEIPLESPGGLPNLWENFMHVMMILGFGASGTLNPKP